MDLQEQVAKAKKSIMDASAELVSFIDSIEQSHREKLDSINVMNGEIGELVKEKVSLSSDVEVLSVKKQELSAAVADMKAFLAKYLK